jgi:E3 ubiquitin-protein ligase HUWE1
MLEVFTDEIRQFDPHNRSEAELGLSNENLQSDIKVNLATHGAKHILTLYLMLVAGKSIVDANQTAAMISRSERDRTRPEYFCTGQFLVEIRIAVLPTIRRLWESDLVEKATNQIPNRLIDIIRTIAMADYEQGAFKRADKVVVQAKTSPKPWKVNAENLTKLTEAGFSEDLAKEALFRCNNTYSSAVDYCKAQVAGRSGGRNHIPQSDLDALSAANSSSRVHTGPSTGTATPVISDHQPMQIDEPLIDVSAVNAANQEMQPPVFPNDPMDMSLDGLLEGDSIAPENAVASAASTTGHSDATPPSPSQQSIMTTTDSQTRAITVDDLNEERIAIRDHLVDRCLDVINDHGEVTFEICDLIKTVVDKSDDPTGMRKEMGATLVQALMSFATKEDVRVVGKNIAAYAHLLALMLQDKSFYSASVGELKDNLPTLLAFVKLSPTHSSEESSPWIAHILLIIETLLCEDAQPYETDWKFPASETSVIENPVLKLTVPAVSGEDRILLFNLILEILPRIGKDESLALAVLRVLVILTRSRNIAQAMGEKKNIQRLFVMAKQLAGATSARLQSPLMLILRHIIEDDETIKQIMRSEIKAFLESPRTQRHIDVASYIRQLSHLVIRAPELFVEVTNEMVKLNKWSPSTAETPGRQQITLQDHYRNPSRRDTDDIILPNIQSTEPLSISDVKPSTETVNGDSTEKVKSAQPENKTPVVENPDGVIHFLLCELLNYKDVEDKDPGVPPLEKPIIGNLSGPTDAAMMDVGSPAPTDSSTTTDHKDSKKQIKQEFKAEEHPIYIYRCFLLQCLTELLSCYNRTKIEFINFKRSAPPQAMTPAKPRSSVVNYLLYDLIPVGTLDHADTIALRKKLTTSSWADSVLTALLSKTGEQIMDRERDATDAEDEPDLLFVRKFVLENILKAYKDASSSTDPLDTKYARMLSLADLMNHIMAGKENHAGASDPTVATRSGLQLRRVMFEKGYIAALTSSIADLDLNFPGAKRAVKHILRPLKVLTQTAIELSDSGKVSLAPGQADDEEIASASSTSEIDDEREETPDLFRNSTLGMFEPGRDNDSSSDSDDGESPVLLSYSIF